MLARGMRAGCGEPARGPLPNGRRRAQVCLFSYGQSGAGKTHTMQGGRAPDAQGIIPRSVFKARPALPRRALPGRDALSRMRRAAAQRARSVLPLDACAIGGCVQQDHNSLACMSVECMLGASHCCACTHALASRVTCDPIRPGPGRPCSAARTVQAARWDATLQAPVVRCRGTL